MATPVISPNDTRLYRTITLENKLTALLISDKDTDKSAASLTVHVGQIQDPVERPGLAHFLEHMLFLGTKKYPNQSEYSQYISSNSGSNNAYTAYLDTNYFFDISTSALNGGLDRFAQFFIEPLFTEDCTEREMNAVDSEHSKNLMSDSWRKYQLFRSTSKKGHPFNKFGTGNKETLSHPTIREDLLAFYKKYYSANIMKLCVYGKEDLDTLEKWTREMFSDVKNHDTVLPKIEEIPFDKEHLGTLWKVVPIEDSDYLEIQWVTENINPYYRDNPGHYITTLIGHEGKNSLLSYLIDEGLALELSAYHYTHMDLFTEFHIGIKLTKKGLAEYERVARITFQYIKMLKDHGVNKELWEEFRKVLKLKFNYKDKEKPINYVNTLSVRMNYYPIEDVVQLSHLMEEYKPELIKKIIDSFTLDNMRVYLVSKSVEPECDMTEEWYKTKYTYKPFSSEFKAMFENPNVGPSKSGKILDLPPTNYFIPQNFDIFAKDLTSLPKYPKKIFSSDRVEIWFKQDNTFSKPKASIYFQIYCSDHGFNSQPETFLLFQIWSKLFNESLRELMYEAETAALSIKINDTPEGIRVTISGFNDSMNKACEAVFQRLKEFNPLERKEHFEDIVHDMIKENENFSKKSPYQQAFALHDFLIQKDDKDCHPEVAIKILKKITFDKLMNFHQEWLKTSRVDCLVIGNITEENTIQIGKNVESILANIRPDSTPLPKELVPEIRVLNIPFNTTWFYEHCLKEGENGEKEPNSAIIAHFQFERETPLHSVILDIMANYLKEPVFEVLRTNEQLGYIVFGYKTEARGVLGYNILVQSSKKGPQYLSQRIFAFIDGIRDKIKNLTNEEFAQYVESVRVKIAQQDLSIQEEANRYWKEIAKHTYLFDRKEVSLDELTKVKKEDVITLFEDIFYKNRRLFETHVISLDHAAENSEHKKERLTKEANTKEVPTPEWIKRRLPLYPDFNSMF